MTIEQDIKENYLKLKAPYFAKKYNKSLTRIYDIASKEGVARGKKRKESLREEVCRLYYEEKLSVAQVDERITLGHSTIERILKEKDGLRSCEEAKEKKYTCEVTFFEKIDTPEKAYWFGFIAADGNLYNKKLQIGLARKDKDHLEKFCKRINFNGQIYKDKVNFKLIIARKKIFDDLCKLGLTENKTFTINHTLFEKIPKEYLAAAMHGYFDGDGSFSILNYKKHNLDRTYYLNFCLLGNEDFLLFFKRELENLGITISRVRKDKRTKQTYVIVTRLTKERANILYKFFYEGEFSSKDYLDRKKQRLTLVLNDGKFTQI